MSYRRLYWARPRGSCWPMFSLITTIFVTSAAAAQEDYVRTYVQRGPPPMNAVAEFVDNTSFPPRLKAQPSDERHEIARTELDLDEPALEAARRTALAHPEARAALGARYVEIAIGADVPAKAADGKAGDVTVGIEFFSYDNLVAVRVGVVRGEVAFVRKLEAAYQPAETAVEIARAVEIVAANERWAALIRGATPQGLLDPCEQSVRCLYVQFMREDGIITFAATVDLINERVFDEVENPDETPDPEGDPRAAPTTQGTRP